MSDLARYQRVSIMSPEDLPPFGGVIDERKLQKWMLEDLDKIYELRHSIAVHDFNATKARIDTQIAKETANEKLDLEFQSLHHQKLNMQIATQTQEAELLGKLLVNDWQKEKNEQEKEKNKQLKLETQSQEIEIELKLKEQREYLNGTDKT